MALTEAQKRANKKWDNAHKEQVKISNYRSRAKSFIKKYAYAEDLKELEKLIVERKEEIK